MCESKRFKPGEVWIPYDPDDPYGKKCQEALMNSMLRSGEFVYKDAVMFRDETTRKRHYWWILIRPENHILRQCKGGKVSTVEGINKTLKGRGDRDDFADSPAYVDEDVNVDSLERVSRIINPAFFQPKFSIKNRF